MFRNNVEEQPSNPEIIQEESKEESDSIPDELKERGVSSFLQLEEQYENKVCDEESDIRSLKRKADEINGFISNNESFEQVLQSMEKIEAWYWPKEIDLSELSSLLSSREFRQSVVGDNAKKFLSDFEETLFHHLNRDIIFSSKEEVIKTLRTQFR